MINGVLGVDYYPEQWPKDLLDQDLDRIVDLGASAIRIGEFAWHLVETREGTYDFSYFDHVIQRAKAKGLDVVYGTPTATFPAWLAQKYPAVLSIDAYGHTRAFGGRRQYCYNNRDYWRLSVAMVEALVAHYGQEPAVIHWQVDNELGHEGSDDCYCSQCHADFHLYLEQSYGHIDALNDTYGTIFWGQTYNDFSQVPMPTPTITTQNPVLKLDWARFRSFSIYRFAHMQVEAIRKNKGAHQGVTHNFFGGYFDRKYDQNKVSDLLDFVAYDNYPVWGGLMAPLSPAEVAMSHAYMYGLKQAPYWIMEQLIGAQGHDDIGYLPWEGESTLWAAQAMARGASSLFYFRYRGATKGQEQFCQGILDADNRINAKYREVQRFYKWARTWQSVLSRPLQKAPVALLYDYDNRFSWQGQRQSASFDYTKALLSFYEGFHNHNIAVDVLDLKKEWMDYPILLLPVMQIVSAELAQELKSYVEQGGILISGYRTAIKDADNNLVFGQTTPCYLNDLFGIEVVGYEALDWPRVWRDVPLLLAQAPVEGGQEVGYTHNPYGKGHAFYVLGQLDSQTMDQLALKATGLANANAKPNVNIEAITSPQGLEVVVRKADKGDLWFIMNHNHHEVAWRGHVFKALEVAVMPKDFDADCLGAMPSGEPIKRLWLKSPSGFAVSLSSLGASILTIMAADRAGGRQNAALCYGEGSRSYDYLHNPHYLGCTVGRTAGRMANGRFNMGHPSYNQGQTVAVALDTTAHAHGLHGGPQGLAFSNWQVVSATPNAVVFGLSDPYKPGKTPGNIDFTATYTLMGDEGFSLHYQAVSDQLTHVNLANHCYFNLGSKTVEGHLLGLDSLGYCPVDDQSLPGEGLLPLKGAMDFSQLANLSQCMPQGLDHPFRLEERGQIHLIDPASGRRLRLQTNQKYVVIYTGNFLGASPSPSGQVLDQYGGICFETQDVPNAPNRSDFDGAWLEPQDTYHHITHYDFTPMD